MTTVTHSLAIIAVVAFITIILRAAPFVIFASRKTVPAWINYLGKFLPPAIMMTLVIYCLRNINFSSSNYWLPEVIATGIVVVLHVWKKNILLTVALSTVCYMVMTQVIWG